MHQNDNSDDDDSNDDDGTATMIRQNFTQEIKT